MKSLNTEIQTFGLEYDNYTDREGNDLDPKKTLKDLGIQSGGKVELYSEEPSAGFGFGHSDPSKGLDKESWGNVRTAANGKPYNIAEHGLNWVSKCSNKDCDIFGNMIIIPHAGCFE